LYWGLRVTLETSLQGPQSHPTIRDVAVSVTDPMNILQGHWSAPAWVRPVGQKPALTWLHRPSRSHRGEEGCFVAGHGLISPDVVSSVGKFRSAPEKPLTAGL
jgi:hypothetical protein